MSDPLCSNLSCFLDFPFKWVYYSNQLDSTEIHRSEVIISNLDPVLSNVTILLKSILTHSPYLYRIYKNKELNINLCLNLELFIDHNWC